MSDCEVRLDTLALEQEFVYSTYDEMEVWHAAGRFVTGRLLYVGLGSCLVEINDRGKIEQTRWALATPVIPVEITDNFEEEFNMTTINPNDPKVKNILSRWKFQLNALVNGAEAAAKQAVQRIPTIIADADKAGLHLPHPSLLGFDAAGENPVITDAAHEFSFEADEAAAAPAPSTKAQKEDAANAERKSKVKAAKAETAKAPKVKKEKVAKVADKPCLDGCGALVVGRFLPGHDAKLKSLIYKIEKGEQPVAALPDVVKSLVKFTKGELKVEKDDKGKVTGKTQLMICTEAPVAIPSR